MNVEPFIIAKVPYKGDSQCDLPSYGGTPSLTLPSYTLFWKMGLCVSLHTFILGRLMCPLLNSFLCPPIKLAEATYLGTAL